MIMAHLYALILDLPMLLWHLQAFLALQLSEFGVEAAEVCCVEMSLA